MGTTLSAEDPSQTPIFTVNTDTVRERIEKVARGFYNIISVTVPPARLQGITQRSFVQTLLRIQPNLDEIIVRALYPTYTRAKRLNLPEPVQVSFDELLISSPELNQIRRKFLNYFCGKPSAAQLPRRPAQRQLSIRPPTPPLPRKEEEDDDEEEDDNDYEEEVEEDYSDEEEEEEEEVEEEQEEEEDVSEVDDN
jgi:hypothetical protein